MGTMRVTHPFATLLHYLSQLSGYQVNTLHGWLYKLPYLILDNILKSHIGCEETHSHSQLVLDRDGDYFVQCFTFSLQLEWEGSRSLW